MDHPADIFYHCCFWFFGNKASHLAGNLPPSEGVVERYFAGSSSVVVLVKVEISLVVAIAEIKRGEK